LDGPRAMAGRSSKPDGDDAERQRRRDLERGHPSGAPADQARQNKTPPLLSAPPSESQRKAASGSTTPRPPSGSEAAIAGHDWNAHFLSGGPASADLSLSLAAPSEPFHPGPPYHLFFGLENRRAERRQLDAMPNCGSLARVDHLVFRVHGNEGT